MLIFRLFFILADKISRFAKSWLPIQNLNSVAVSEILYLNWMYNFMRFSHDFGQNAWTSSLRANLNNDVFWISTVVMRTGNAQVSFHNINSWISSILEIPACTFSFRNLCNVQFHVDHILSKFFFEKKFFYWKSQKMAIFCSFCTFDSICARRDARMRMNRCAPFTIMPHTLSSIERTFSRSPRTITNVYRRIFTNFFGFQNLPYCK